MDIHLVNLTWPKIVVEKKSQRNQTLPSLTNLFTDISAKDMMLKNTKLNPICAVGKDKIYKEYLEP